MTIIQYMLAGVAVAVDKRADIQVRKTFLTKSVTTNCLKNKYKTVCFCVLELFCVDSRLSFPSMQILTRLETLLVIPTMQYNF